MAMLELGSGRALFFEHEMPAAAGPGNTKPCFVFVNALTGSTEQWQATLGPLHAAGYATLRYNFRGQKESQFAPGDVLDEAAIIADLRTLIAQLKPSNPILVGLSIGGLYAAKAFLAGSAAAGLVLINTLRKPGLVLDWTNEAIYRATRLGGSQLVMDMFLPMLVGPAKLAELRANCLKNVPYEPFPPGSGLLGLVENSRSTDWNIAYEQLTLPTLVITGLRDRAFLNRADVSELFARLPNAQEVTMPETGHLVPAEAPQELAAQLIAFGNRIGANQSGNRA